MLSFAVGAGEAPVLAASILRGSGICCRIASQIGDLLRAAEDTRKSGTLERASCSGWETIGCDDLESSGNGFESNPESALVRPVGADLLGLSMVESVRVVCGFRTAGIGSLALGNWQRDQLCPQHLVGRRLLHSGTVLSKPAKEAKAEETYANDGAQGPADLVGMNANGSGQGDDAIEQNAESEAQELTFRSNEESAVDGGGQGHAPAASEPVADVQVPASMDDSPRHADDAKEDRGKNVKGRNFAREQTCTVSIVAKAFEPEMVEHFQDSVLAVWVRDEKPTSEALTDGSGQKVEALPAGQANSNPVSSAQLSAPPRTKARAVSASLPVYKRRFTVLRSPHIDKKSREQFEINVHKRIVKISVNMQELPLLVDWLKENAFIGVQLGVTVNYQTPLSLKR